jgi:hypothetical protein
MVLVAAQGVRVCGRWFCGGDLDLVRRIVASDPPPHRREIARRTCEALGWRRPDGRLKEMSCRVALLRLMERGFISLPPPRTRNANRERTRPREPVEIPAVSVAEGVGRIAGLSLRAVSTAAESRLWNSAVAEFHYLGYRPLPGAQMRYLLTGEVGLLAVLGFGAGAWKVAPRDRWIGWSHEQREARLHRVVDNARFLILPGVRSRNLASFVLSACLRRLPGDFRDRYGYEPVLVETFVERDRFSGTCYLAAGFTHVGDTQGRGKLDRRRQYGLPVKRILLRPLVRDFRRVLCG